MDIKRFPISADPSSGWRVRSWSLPCPLALAAPGASRPAPPNSMFSFVSLSFKPSTSLLADILKLKSRGFKFLDLGAKFLDLGPSSRRPLVLPPVAATADAAAISARATPGQPLWAPLLPHNDILKPHRTAISYIIYFANAWIAIF